MVKVNLCGNSTEYMNGYLNVADGLYSDPNTLSENTKVVAGRYNNLDPVLADSSVDEIVFSLPLNVITPSSLVENLEHWGKKLKPGGILKMHFLDIRRIGLEIVRGSSSLEQIDNYLFGPNRELNCLLDCATMKVVLNSLGFKINILSLSDLVGSVEVMNGNIEN